MANGNEKMHCFKIRMRQFAYRTIAFNEGVPKRVLLLLEQNTSVEKYREIVGQISGTAFVEIEEHRLSGSRSVQHMVAVEPVAALIACGEAASGIVNPCQGHPVCSCIGSRTSCSGRASFRITEQDGGTSTFREKGRCKKRAVTHRNCGGHRNALAVQISEKRGFRRNIGITARTSL